MSNPKPVRWKASLAFIANSPNQWVITDGQWGSPNVAVVNNEINAHLIAAAPDMLNAIKAAKAELLTYLDDAQCDHSVNICWCNYHDTLGLIDTAIAKAEGLEND